MKFNWFMTIFTLVLLLFGLAFLLFPAQSMTLYDLTLEGEALNILRYFGAGAIGMAVLAWLSRNASPSPTRKAIVLGFFVYSLLGLVVAIYDKFTGVMVATDWITVVVYLVFAVGFGYFAFSKQAG